MIIFKDISLKKLTLIKGGYKKRKKDYGKAFFTLVTVN